MLGAEFLDRPNAGVTSGCLDRAWLARPWLKGPEGAAVGLEPPGRAPGQALGCWDLMLWVAGQMWLCVCTEVGTDRVGPRKPMSCQRIAWCQHTRVGCEGLRAQAASPQKGLPWGSFSHW